MVSAVLITALAASAFAAQETTGEFEKPVLIMAGGKPIDVEIGHAAPYLYDFDCDGKCDLLVGQFGGPGKLRIYRNTGTDQKPVYADHQWLMADGVVATTPVS